MTRLRAAWRGVWRRATGFTEIELLKAELRVQRHLLKAECAATMNETIRARRDAVHLQAERDLMQRSGDRWRRMALRWKDERNEARDERDRARTERDLERANATALTRVLEHTTEHESRCATCPECHAVEATVAAAQVPS